MTWFAFSLTFVVWFNHAPLLAHIKATFDLSAQQIKALMILNVALTIPARIVIGILVDKFGPPCLQRSADCLFDCLRDFRHGHVLKPWRWSRFSVLLVRLCYRYSSGRRMVPWLNRSAWLKAFMAVGVISVLPVPR